MPIVKGFVVLEINEQLDIALNQLRCLERTAARLIGERDVLSASLTRCQEECTSQVLQIREVQARLQALCQHPNARLANNGICPDCGKLTTIAYEPEGCYYILSYGHWSGDCYIWWRPGSGGYTPNLGEAGRYPPEWFRDRRLRSRDIPLLCSEVDACSVSAVIQGALDHLLKGKLPTRC